eukprot:TRINITY_DN12230_c0_g1_i2.p1 TRINITY_DN12230_c0_g1~~TRINITY_DN12230_c0_g1_i2.p1  ORF type:complete len:518 (-),score=44.44 TRINITY_DN12230_c0_g1_i2:137-1531(-)
MPEGTSLCRIRRFESKQLYLPYAAYRETVRGELGWELEELESWLFHGTDSVEEILKDGFSSGNVNLKFNKYGAGVYFARDPRMAQFFIRRSRNDLDAELQLLLCRVVVGWCSKKPGIKNSKELLRPDNRRPPDKCHSVTSDTMPGREIIVFPGSPGTPVYPAYVLSYTTQSRVDPYRDNVGLLRLELPQSGRERSHVFKKYRLQYRPRWQAVSNKSTRTNPNEPDDSVAHQQPPVTKAIAATTSTVPAATDGTGSDLSKQSSLCLSVPSWKQTQPPALRNTKADCDRSRSPRPSTAKDGNTLAKPKQSSEATQRQCLEGDWVSTRSDLKPFVHIDAEHAILWYENAAKSQLWVTADDKLLLKDTILKKTYVGSFQHPSTINWSDGDVWHKYDSDMAADKSDPAELEKGDAVKIINVDKHPHLMGQTGRVEHVHSRPHKSTKYDIRLEEGILKKVGGKCLTKVGQ